MAAQAAAAPPVAPTPSARPVETGPSVEAARAAAVRLVALGAGAGALWGVAARWWMRQLTFDPSFSWSGTLAIVGLAALFGACCAVVEVLRRRRARAWRAVAALPGSLLFAGPGVLLLPGALLTGFALSGRGPRWSAALAAGLAQAPLVWVAQEFVGNPVPAPGVVALGGMAVLVTALGLGTRLLFLRRPAAPRACV